MAVLTRRTALGGLAGSVLGGGLAGGCRSPIDPINPDDPKLTDPTTPFTADVHTHVFNAVDVQTALIFEKVLEHDHPELQVFGPLLGDLGNFAPSVKDENEALNGLEGCRQQPQSRHRAGGRAAAARGSLSRSPAPARRRLPQRLWPGGAALPAARPRLAGG